jgi:hypothetical protein
MTGRRLPRTLLAIALAAACVSGTARAADKILEMKAQLTSAQEVPPLETRAGGTAKFEVTPDGYVVGTVQTYGINGVAAYIAQGAADVNGRVVVPLKKKNDHEWVTPEGAALTAKQLDAFKIGDLYVNVDTDTHPSGQVRGVLHE